MFINYTLAGTAKDITKLSPTLFPINTTFTSTDFVAAASAIDYEPIEDRNLNAILATLATSSLYNERVRTFIDSQITYTSTESSSFQPSDIPLLLHNSFLMLLSNISNPFVNGILAFLTILAFAWGFILTIVTCRYAFSSANADIHVLYTIVGTIIVIAFCTQAIAVAIIMQTNLKIRKQLNFVIYPIVVLAMSKLKCLCTLFVIEYFVPGVFLIY